MIFCVEARWSRWLLLSVSHGFTDIVRYPMHLWLYALVLIPFPSTLITLSFIVLSVYHFNEDIGFIPSILLHVLLVLLHVLQLDSSAWGLLCGYMYAIHLPLHISSSTACENLIMAIACMILVPFSSKQIRLNETMQKIVSCHILVASLNQNAPTQDICE